MGSTKWNQIENIQFQLTKHCYVKYSYAHQVLNISYSNPLYDIEDLFLDDTITAISPGAASTIKGKIIVMVTSIETNTSNILLINNLSNTCPMYKIYK